MSTASALILTLALAANGDAVLLEFTAEWCGPCRVMQPTVGRLVSAGYPVRKIDVDRDAQTASRYNIRGVPCFVMLVDGQEVERVTGAVSHDRLLQMYQTARSRRPNPGGQPLPAGPASSAPSSPAGSEFPSLTSLPANSRISPRENPVPQGNLSARDRLSGRGGVVRGQSPDGNHVTASHGPPGFASTAGRQAGQLANLGTARRPTAARVDPNAVRAAFQATVRLRVEDPQGHGYGTGTIIDVHGREALVVTCGHLFRDSQGKGTITVDLFHAGKAQTVPAQLISYDLDRDIALVSITPGQRVLPARIASSGQGIARGVPVFSIGCDKGDAPSVRESHVTAIDRYLGPPNIEVAGQPVDGRSGGGLFSGDGYLIGICNAADPADDEGIYAGLATIHWELDRIGQRRIYEAVAQAPPVTTGEPTPSAGPLVPHAAPPTMPDRMAMPAVASQIRASEPGVPNTLGSDTEVICIIRSRNNPQGDQRLLVLDRPSADLLARLRQESQAGVASLARQPAIRPTTRPPRRGNNPVIRAQSSE